ncbi:aldo/keto reductase [Pseudonocardia ailaonensis]|uniref:Aldo/keto reductase n=1 Tax=Pseudonocardia ailaonensis TaxID=367279 RepID=A0ABN2MKT9_9PSEU
MKTRPLGRSGVQVSAVGVGCNPLSGSYGSRDDDESVRMIHRALDLGVTLFDTGDVYGHGHNEKLLGRALAGRRDEALIATKFGAVLASDATESDRSGLPKRSSIDGTPAYVKAACEASLRRLGVDTIDLYQQHRVDPTTPIEDTVGALAELVAEGKIRYIGLCEAGESDLRRAVGEHPVATLQSEYSLIERGLEGGMLGVCEELGVSLVPFAPLGRGLLSGTLTADTQLEDGDIRLSGAFPRLAAESLTANARLADAVRAIAASYHATPAQIALAWLLSRREWIIPIPGMPDDPRHLEENVASDTILLDAADIASLDALGEQVTGDRYKPELATNAGASTPPRGRSDTVEAGR